MALSLTAGFGLGCGEDQAGFTRVAARGFFDPESIDFQTQPIDEAHAQDVRFTNASDGELLVTDVLFDPPQDAFVARRDDGGTLKGSRFARGESRLLRVLFGPSTEARYDTTMLVQSDRLQIELPIKAAGRRVVPATLEVVPNSVTFSSPIEVGREVRQDLRVTNVGERAGRLARLETPGVARVVDLDGSSAAPSMELDPGESLDLALYFRPAREGEITDTVRFFSSAEVVTELPIRATAIAAGVLGCDRTSVELGDVLRGTSRAEPVRCTITGGGFTLEALRLTTAVPGLTLENASAAPGSSVNQIDFDVRFVAAGLPHAVTGVVEIAGAAGQRVQIPVSAAVVAPPPGVAALSLELSWATTNTDFDLHLVRGGAQPFQDGEDCHFGRKTLDWNTPGDDRDDPFLDQDDTLGPGVERLTMLDGRSGTYEIWVQYYAHPVEAPSSVDVTLTYQLGGGGPMGTRTRTFTECGNMWHLGTARFDQSPPQLVLVDTESNAWGGRTSRCF